MALQFLNDGVFSGDVAGTILIAQKASIPPSNGSFIGRLSFKAYNVGTTYSTGANITAVASSAWTSTSTGTHLQFSTTSDASVNPVNRMYLTSGGDLGVGVQFPGSRISVSGFTGSYTSGIGFEPVGTGARTYRTFINTDGSFNLDDATAGETRLTIDSTGKVGIGAISPDALLHVESTSATGANFILESTHSGGIPLLDLKGAASAQLRYKDELNVIQGRIDFGDSGTFNFIDVPNNKSTLYLKTGGDVGIGTVTPRLKLEVQGIAMPLTNDPASVEDLITLYRNGSAQVWSGGATLSLGRYITGDGSNPNSRLDFKLKNAAGSNTALPETTVMTMQSNGNVGIGTTTPAKKLDIVSTTSDAAGEMRLAGILASDNLPFGKINFANTAAANTQTNEILAYIAGEKADSSNRGELTFATSDSASPTEKMRIDSSGNVGIGTNSPRGKLDVVGNTDTDSDFLTIQDDDTSAGSHSCLLYTSPSPRDS